MCWSTSIHKSIAIEVFEELYYFTIARESRGCRRWIVVDPVCSSISKFRRMAPRPVSNTQITTTMRARPEVNPGYAKPTHSRMRATLFIKVGSITSNNLEYLFSPTILPTRLKKVTNKQEQLLQICEITVEHAITYQYVPSSTAAGHEFGTDAGGGADLDMF